LLDTHVEVGAVDLEDPEIKKHIVGSTGQCAEFRAPYLVNDLVIWTAGAIAGVDSKEQTELSCAYRYKIDMTPGDYEGTHYDGRMTGIVGNHVALVEEGRAGHDVVVADSKVLDVISELSQIKKKVTDTMKPGAPEEGRKMLDDMTGALDVAVHHLLDYEEDFPEQLVPSSTTKDSTPQSKIGAAGAEGGKAHDSKESHMATKDKQHFKLKPLGYAVQGALLAHLRPRLAADAAVGPKEVAAILRNIEPGRFKRQLPGIIGTVKEHFSSKLAKDADLDIEELKELLENIGEMGEELDESGMEEDIKPLSDEDMGTDADPGELLIKKLESLNLAPADMEEIGGYLAKIAMPKAEPAAPEATDEFPPKKEEEGTLPPKKEGEAMQAPPITKPAMDAALRLVQAETRKETIADIGERYQAAEIVKPLIGKVDALAVDSAASIYKMALDANNIKTEGVHSSAYKAMVEMLTSKTEPIVADAALAAKADAGAAFHEIFPNAVRVGKA
jgi:hypothetical protein